MLSEGRVLCESMCILSMLHMWMYSARFVKFTRSPFSFLLPKGGKFRGHVPKPRPHRLVKQASIDAGKSKVLGQPELHSDADHVRARA